MFHLGERTLEKLVAGAAPVPDVERIRQHVRECRLCARKLEEWRETYPEIDDGYPELAHADNATRYTESGLVVVPEKERKWFLPAVRIPSVNFANVLWVVALLMAVLVGYGANRLRSAGDGFDAETAARIPKMPRPESGTGAGVPMPLASPSDSLVRVAPPPSTLTQKVIVTSPGTDSEGSSAQRVSRTRSAAEVREPRSTPAQTIDTRADPPPPVAASPSFRNVATAEAARRLGGPVRVLRGIEVDHIEVGPPAAVPGALPGLPVVRVVYRTEAGGRMLLDQQLVPSENADPRLAGDLERGQTAFGTAPNGVSVATWLDAEGYRLSLVVQAPVDSIKQLIQLVY